MALDLGEIDADGAAVFRYRELFRPHLDVADGLGDVQFCRCRREDLNDIPRPIAPYLASFIIFVAGRSVSRLAANGPIGEGAADTADDDRLLLPGRGHVVLIALCMIEACDPFRPWLDLESR
ncbi:MAG: hypothetical protein R3D33_02580 [Hyphomicrobiaceae bacterium]